MNPVVNAALGVLFLVVGVAATVLMYHLWGYPFNKEKLESEAPPRWMFVHRLLGWTFVVIYVVLMAQMLPRLWAYQIEFPARTVLHLALGMAIGALLFAKIVIVRYFKHLEGELAPILGTALMVCSIMVIGLSAPFAFRETYLQARTFSAVEEADVEAIQRHLLSIGLEDPEEAERFASPEGLGVGRGVLLGQCVECHDLRTVLIRPRTPKNWRQTVERMAERAGRIAPIDEDEQWAVTAYLIALSPDLRRSASERLAEEKSQARAVAAARQATPAEPDGYDPERARTLIEGRCSLCHPAQLIESSPPDSAEAARDLVERMVSNGLEVSTEESALIIRHLTETYAQPAP